MYKRKIVFVLMFIFIDVLLICFYLWNLDKGIALEYVDNFKPIIKVYDDNLCLKYDSDYNIYDNFKIYARSNLNLYHDTNLNKKEAGDYIFTLYAKTKYYKTSKLININVAQKETIEVIKEVYVNTNKPIINNQTISQDIKEEITKPENQKYNVYENIKDISLPLNSTVEDLVNALIVKSENESISIDYGNVNLTIKGEYEVYYIAESFTKTIIVTIY